MLLNSPRRSFHHPPRLPCKKCPGETCPNQFSLTEYNHHLLIGGAFAALLIGFVAYKKMQ